MTPGEEVALYVCPTRSPWSRVDLTALNLNGVTKVLWNFSAPCLNQPVKTLYLGWARYSAAFLACCLVVPLCWSMTCKYQTLALVTSPNTAHLHADASGKCLSLPQYVQCRLQADGKAHPILALPAWYVGLCLLRPNERCQDAFFLGVCFCKANEALLLPDAGVELHSWVNSQCLLYSMTCLKWHAGPKEGGDQLRSRHSPTWSGSISSKSISP